MEEKSRPNLLDLPDELLCEIARHVEVDSINATITLANLSKTNRRLYVVAQAFLYKKISFQFHHLYLRQHRIRHLVETLAQRNALCDLVRKLEFNFPSRLDYPLPRDPGEVEQLLRIPGPKDFLYKRILYSGLIEGDGDAPGALLTLMLPRLETIYVDYSKAPKSCDPVGHNLTHYIFKVLEAAGRPGPQGNFHCFSTLKEVTLKCYENKHEKVSGALFLLPALRKVHLQSVRLKPRDYWACPPSASLVEDLKISRIGPENLSGLERLFQSFARLRHVRLERWGNQATRSHQHHDDDWRNGPIFDALKIQMHSLESIHYYVRIDRKFVSHSTPMMDMREFKKLRKLAITDVTLFNWDIDHIRFEGQDESRRFLLNTLPSSLESFSLLPYEHETIKQTKAFAAKRSAWWRGVWEGWDTGDAFPNFKSAILGWRKEQ